MKTTFFLLRPLLLLLSALIVFIPVAQASGQAGQVIMVTGQVTALAADGSERALQRRSAIAVTDTVVTGPGSRVQIRFIDNALLALQENSRLNIREYHLAQEGAEQSKVLMELVEGGFRTLTGSIGKGNEQAYQVTTPVASIGIRGTLYSLLLQGNQLTAGVWQGGIALNMPGGQRVNLGNDSSFSFGRIGPSGFQGLLQPPAELDPAPAGQFDGNSNGNNDNTGAPDDGTGAGSGDAGDAGTSAPAGPAANGLAGGAGVPNPFDQLTPEQIEEQLSGSGNPYPNEPEPVDPEPVDPNEPEPVDPIPVDPQPTLDPRFQSAEEYERYLGSSQTVLMARSDTGEVLMGKAFTGDDGKTVFVTGESSQLVLYRYGGATTYPGTVEDSLVSWMTADWGIWGNGSDSVQQYANQNSETSATIVDPVFWISAEPMQLGNPTEANYLVQATPYLLGEDSFGNLLGNSEARFNINLESREITEGSFSASYFPDSETPNDYTFWSFSFTGAISVNDQQEAMLSFTNISDSSVSGYKNEGSDMISGTINADISLFNGFLIGTDGTPSGAATQHYLQAVLNDANGNPGTETIWANGVMLWQATPVTGP